VAAPVTLEAYNVDTADVDTASVALGSLFRPDRFLGSRTFAPDSLRDSIRIPINADTVALHMVQHTRLRIGLRVVSAKSATVLIESHDIGSGPRLLGWASKDTTVAPVSNTVFSTTPTSPPFFATALADFVI